MKISILIPLLAVLILAGAVIIQGSGIFSSEQLATHAGEIVYPAAVKKVIDQKCYGCHSDKGQSQDAKDALMWDELPALAKGKMVATFDNIIGVLEDGTMPPEDVVEKYPEIKLLTAERDLLISWATAKADSLLK